MIRSTRNTNTNMIRRSNNQTDLPNMPKPDGVGHAAQNFRTAIERLDAALLEKGEAAAALHKALVKAKRTAIQIDGYKFERVHTGPKDTIKVTKPK